jgi:hypothetical protein
MCNDENLAPRAALAEPPEPFRELFAGRQDEPPEERAARLAAAGDVLAELLEQGGADSVALEDAQYALWLSRSPLVQRGHDICAPSDWWGRVA